ncbi:MAG: hypothetical protein CFE24_06220 [Flavobacterium sp. BFFFF2]|nr:MAG: hypothetical protein CFE24_06220 [Flavobacterium sp. BFFFF2]
MKGKKAANLFTTSIRIKSKIFKSQNQLNISFADPEGGSLLEKSSTAKPLHNKRQNLKPQIIQNSKFQKD